VEVGPVFAVFDAGEIPSWKIQIRKMQGDYAVAVDVDTRTQNS
jgi:hypothetical protein